MDSLEKILVVYIGSTQNLWFSVANHVVQSEGYLSMSHLEQWRDNFTLPNNSQMRPILLIDRSNYEKETSSNELVRDELISYPRVILSDDSSIETASTPNEIWLSNERTDHHQALTNAIQRLFINELVFGKKQAQFNKQQQQRESKALRMIAGAAHDLRTPLSVILGACRVIGNRQFKNFSEISPWIDRIKRNAEDLNQIIEKYLNYAKLEHCVFNVDRKPVNLKEVIDTDLEPYIEACAEKSLSLSYIIDDSLPRILLIDHLLMMQVVGNLIGNAIKFTKIGAIKVKLSYDNQSNALSIDVSDTGIGVAPSMRNKLFNCYSQGDTDLPDFTPGCGVGLGLNNAQMIAKALGGEVSLKWSELGRGSTFCATFLAYPYRPESNEANAPNLLLAR